MSEIKKCPNLLRGGGSAFLKNVWNSKMSQFGQRGGQHFSKMSEIQKCPKGRRGTNWDIVPNFLDFLFWCLPLGYVRLNWGWVGVLTNLNPLDQMRNICKRNILIRGLEVGEVIPFPDWIIFPFGLKLQSSVEA